MFCFVDLFDGRYVNTLSPTVFGECPFWQGTHAIYMGLHLQRYIYTQTIALYRNLQFECVLSRFLFWKQLENNTKAGPSPQFYTTY